MRTPGSDEGSIMMTPVTEVTVADGCWTLGKDPSPS